MESASQSTSASEPPSHRLAEIVGTAIAVLTLALPILAIAHYSPSNDPITETITYPLQQSRD